MNGSRGSLYTAELRQLWAANTAQALRIAELELENSRLKREMSEPFACYREAEGGYTCADTHHLEEAVKLLRILKDPAPKGEYFLARVETERFLNAQ